MDQRYRSMLDWLEGGLAISVCDVTPASSDASFRRYFRVRHDGSSHIVMDAPPDKEDSRPFVAVARRLGELGLNVPRVLAADLDQGFLLLTDLGDRHYLAALDETCADRLYDDAMDALLVLWSRGDPAGLPPYDKALLHREMNLFREWYLGWHLGLELDSQAHAVLDRTWELLAGNALEQPQGWVLRDYHSRNLMLTRDNNPGILDFQDAVGGPLTYDLVSLLRDCYIAWPRQQVETWALGHRARLAAAGVECGDAATFLRWFDLMGVQRHLKAAGIFARLNHRDGKPNYLYDIPRTLSYIHEVSGRHRGLTGLRRLLEDHVL